MQILHLLNTRCYGGIEVHVLDCIESMTAMGHPSHLICKTGLPPELVEVLKSKNIPFMTLPLGGVMDFFSLFALIRFCRSKKIDILHTHQPNDALRAILAKPFTGAQVIFSRHGCYPVKSLTGLFLNMCSKVVAISGAVFKLLVNAGIKPEKITILRHGKTVPKTMDFKEACKITGLNPERKFILCSGRLSDEKNQLLAVESFAKLIKGNPDTTRMMDLIILGKDFDKGSSYLQQIRKRAEELKISNRIITPGHVLNVEPWLRASMLGLVTSRTEGLSYSMIEYMAASIPVISTPCEGPLEIIESGRNGFIAPANPEDFAKSIMNSIDKPTYEKLSKGAYETWKEFFNHEAMVARLDQIYRDSLM